MQTQRFDCSNLFQILADRGQPQTWLARKVGINNSYLWLIRHGKRTPSAALRKRIAEVMGKDEGELFLELSASEKDTEEPNGDAA